MPPLNFARLHSVNESGETNHKNDSRDTASVWIEQFHGWQIAPLTLDVNRETNNATDRNQWADGAKPRSLKNSPLRSVILKKKPQLPLSSREGFDILIKILLGPALRVIGTWS